MSDAENDRVDEKANVRAKKACDRCKQRKKKCSGIIPCDYCTRLRVQCVFTERRQVLRNRQLPKGAVTSQPGSEFEFIYQNGALEVNDDIYPSADSSDSPYKEFNSMGGSSCMKFLAKMKQEVAKVPRVSNDNSVSIPLVEYPPMNLRFLPELDRISKFTQELPDSNHARYLLEVVSIMVGADYVFLESDYIEKVLPEIYSTVQMTWDFAASLARLFILLAIGCVLDSENHKGNEIPGLKYYENSLKLIGDLTPVLDVVVHEELIQSYLYVAYYSMLLDKHKHSYLYIGVAARMLFELGFHKKCENGVQNRLFWMCYVYDRMTAVCFGYPFIINDHDIHIPIDLDNPYSLESTHFAAQIKLHKIKTLIVHKVYSKNNYYFTSNCRESLWELKKWFEKLPPKMCIDYNNFKSSYSRATLNLHTSYNHSVIMAARPVLLHVFSKLITPAFQGFIEELKEDMSVLIEACISAAEANTKILSSLYFEGRYATAAYFDSHHLFSATMILIIIQYCHDMNTGIFRVSHEIESILDERIKVCMSIMAKVSNRNMAAVTFHNQLVELIALTQSHKLHTVPQLITRTLPPMTQMTLDPLYNSTSGSDSGKPFTQLPPMQSPPSP